MNKKNILLFFFFYSVMNSFFALNPKLSDTNLTNNKSIGFMENKGQLLDEAGRSVPSVFYKCSLQGLDIYITKYGVTYVMMKNGTEEENEELEKKVRSKMILPPGYKMKEEKEGENKVIHYCKFDVGLNGGEIKRENIIEEEEDGATYWYYLPHCPNGIKTKKYAKLTIKNVYPGIDWVFQVNKRSLVEYDFIVHPYADASQLKIFYKSAYNISIKEGKQLSVKTDIGTMTEGKLSCYQENNSEIGSTFIIKKKAINNCIEVDIKLAAYDRSKDLIIDPPLVWSTFFGGAGTDGPIAATCDKDDNLYITGYGSPDAAGFPLKDKGTYYSVVNGLYITKFTKTGVLDWSTCYGGSGGEHGAGLTCDKSGNVYVTGTTQSVDFPTQANGSAYFDNTKSGAQDIFILKFDNNGTRLWATLYGGNGFEGNPNSTDPWIAVDINNNLFACFMTMSSDLETQANGTAYYDNTLDGLTDFAVLKFDANGTRVWGTYYGGPGLDEYGGSTITLDKFGNLFFGGVTITNDPFPTQANGAAYFQPNHAGGGHDAFIVKFDNNGNRLWGTLYGGSGDEGGSVELQCDPANGDVYFVGTTSSTDFPLLASTGYYFDTIDVNYPIAPFIVKFDNNGNRLLSTYYDGFPANFSIGANLVETTIDSCGNLFMSFGTAGKLSATQSDGLPGTYIQTTPNATTPDDPYIVKFAPNMNVTWATYFGGNFNDQRNVLTTNSRGDLYVIGEWRGYNNTQAASLPIVNLSGAYNNPLPANSSSPSDDLFIAQFAYTTPISCGLPVVNFSADDTVLCKGDCINFNDSTSGSPTLWSWTFENGTPSYSTVQNPANICYNNSGSFKVKLKATNIRGTDSTEKLFYITVYDPPLVNAGADDTILSGNSVHLSTPGIGTTYIWTPTDGLSCSDCPDPIAGPLITTLYQVTVIDSNGCSASDSIKIYVEEINCSPESIYIPSGFSPNNDGNNDVFCIQGIYCLSSIRLSIYDRWGEKVFETFDRSACWNGLYKGKPLSTAVFSYYINALFLNKQAFTKKGTITLIK